tara:strand:+ start:2270 stop:2653 length:384 start_codon:yes stop_codon:yes gene_type:complete
MPAPPERNNYTTTEMMNAINDDGYQEYTLKEALHRWLIIYCDKGNLNRTWDGVLYGTDDLNKYGTVEEVLNVICGAGLHEYTVTENLNRIRAGIAGQSEDLYSHTPVEAMSVIQNTTNFQTGADKLL